MAMVIIAENISTGDDNGYGSNNNCNYDCCKNTTNTQRRTRKQKGEKIFQMKKQREWILRILVAIVTIYFSDIPLMSNAAGLGQPSVYFVESAFGDMFMAPNMTFDRSKAIVVLTGLNQCSVVGKYVFGADNLLYLEMVTRYSYKEAKRRCNRLPGHRLIIIKSQEAYDYFTSLGSNTSPFWVADLQKINESYFLWGDGTTYQESGLGSSQIVSDDGVNGDVFVSLNSKLDDKNSSAESDFKVVCQANPYGIEW
ncbi:uncharacterized protein LOC135224889 [Macrobrachium nipponense]|uniref:uncharacterized protein LOC135224889 n=1 Tax=Macrobrachium nipponense TaxID=159736 RepID=UPI0030C83F6B